MTWRQERLRGSLALRKPKSSGRAPESASARRAEGRALRASVPRASHSVWRPSPERSDPIALLKASSEDRLPQLIPLRYGRMLHSPFAFYRGVAILMAADLAATPATGLWALPSAQLRRVRHAGAQSKL